MFARHGMKNTLRTAGRSLIFFLLIALLVVLLGASLGLTVTVDRFLEECRTGYTTIGVLEYAGDYSESAVRQATDALDTDALLANPAVDSYSPDTAAFGYLPEAEDAFRNLMMDRMVLVVKPRAYYDDEDAYSCYVTETLYSTRKCPEIIKLVTDGYALEDGHYYLVYTAYFDGGPTAFYLTLTPYPEVAELGNTPPVEDITTDDGYALPTDSPVYQMADTCAMLRRSVTVRAPEELSAFLPFHQNYIGVTEGTATLGATDCLISERLATMLGKSVGDRISLNIFTAEGHSVENSAWAGKAFDHSGEYTVVGIFNQMDDWNFTVFVAPTDDVDMTVNCADTTLGQLRLDNELAQREADAIRAALPDRVQLTIFDQGYSAVSAPIKDMQRTARILSAISIVVGVAFLILYGYLLVYRQRKVGQTMLRVGASRANVSVYFLFGTGLIALPACLVGSVAAMCLSDRIAALVERTLSTAAAADLRYSNTNISVRHELSQTVQSPNAAVFFLIGAAVFVLALASCLYFTRLSVRKPKKQRRVRGSAGARSRSLKGGAVKYALLSAKRGGFRSLIPLLAAACALTLFFRLTDTTESYRDRLDEVRTASNVRGYFTDIHGQSADRLVVPFMTVRDIAKTEHIESYTVTLTTPYHLAALVGAVTDEYIGTTTDPDELGAIEIPDGVYAQERLLNELKAGPSMVITNSLTDVPEFLYGSTMEVEFADGWDESCFASSDASLTETSEVPCVMPQSMLDRYGIALDDSLIIQFFDPTEEPSLDYLYGFGFRVIGAYQNSDGSNTIYVPFSSMIGYGTELFEAEVTSKGWYMSWLTSSLTAESVVFRIDNCANLDAVRESFATLGISEPNRVQSKRIFAVIEDGSFMTTEQSLNQRLWYMERIFPAIYILLEALAFLMGYLQIQQRKKELRIMRSMGASGVTAFFGLWWEQAFLCALGVAIGFGIACADGSFGTDGGVLGGGFFLLWLVGAAISIMKNSGRRLLRRREGE